MANGWSIDSFGAMFEGFLEEGDVALRGPRELGGRAKRGRRTGVRHVALLMDVSTAVGRGVMRGVSGHQREHAGWTISFHGCESGRCAVPRWLMGWKGHGILACVDSVELGEVLEKSGLPVVDVGGGVNRFTRVESDEKVMASMVVEHFRERGLREFGCCDGELSRAEVFREATMGMGSCAVFDWTVAEIGGVWEKEQEALTRWVRNLPRPVGVLAGDDGMGLRLLDACRRAGCVVPNEVAVVSVGNDQMLCEMGRPGLTSVDVNAEQIGRVAAMLLDQLMRTRKGVAGVTRVGPRGVVKRGSTEVLASGDEAVDRAVRFIREKGGSGIGVLEVVEYAGVGRLALQRRMKRVFGRTIHEEIDQARVGRVKEMLLRPEMTIKQIARAAGFSSVQYMTRVFGEAVGETPGRFRRVNESGGE